MGKAWLLPPWSNAPLALIPVREEIHDSMSLREGGCPSKLKRGRLRSDGRKKGMNEKKCIFIFTKRSEAGWPIGAEINTTGMDAERNETKRKGQMRRGNEGNAM